MIASRTLPALLLPLALGAALVAAPGGANAADIIDTIPVGDQPRAVEVSSDGSRAYVANYGSGTVSVINVDTRSVIATITVGAAPTDVELSPNGSELWVTNSGSGTATVITTATNTVAQTINVGGGAPYWVGFSPDGAFAYITHYLSGVVGKYSTATRTSVDSLTVSGYPQGGAVVMDGRNLYVAETNGDQLYYIDTETMELVGSPVAVGEFPTSITAQGGTMWVTNNGTGPEATVSRVDVTGAQTDAVPVGPYPVASAYAVARYLYVPAEDGSISIIDTFTRTVVTEITAEQGTYGVSASDGGTKTIVVSNQILDEVYLLGTDVDRISGADRFQVAVEISKAAFASSTTVYIATGLNYPDALSAGPAAGVAGAPLLLTQTDELPAAVAAEITRLGATSAVVVGGPASVSPSVVEQLEDLVGDGNVTRLSGADRYAASRNIVDYAFTDVDSIYITTGRNFPDALSAGAAGASSGTPVLLVDGLATSLDAPTLALIASLTPDSIQIAGGPASVSPQIQAQLQSLYTVTRHSGLDRYHASTTINEAAFEHATHAFLATGLKFPDALAGSSLAATLDAPLYVVPTDCVPGAVVSQFHRMGVGQVTLLGGPASLTTAVEDLVLCNF